MKRLIISSILILMTAGSLAAARLDREVTYKRVSVTIPDTRVVTRTVGYYFDFISCDVDLEDWAVRRMMQDERATRITYNSVRFLQYAYPSKPVVSTFEMQACRKVN